MASSIVQWECTFCSNNFSRQEHLHRHLMSHELNRPFSCQFCFGAFKRADVLKRHLRNCRRRVQGASASPGVKNINRISRRRACDRCVRQKHACDLRNPCQRCTGRDEPCTYSNARQSIEHVTNESFAASTDDGGSDFPLQDDGTMTIAGSSQTSDSTDLVTNLMSIEKAWEVSNPVPLRQTWRSNANNSVGQDWNAYRISDPTAAWTQLAWPDYLEDHVIFEDKAIHSGYESLYFLDEDAMSSFNFAFLANFTSTTGFVSSFDCGTINERKLIVRNTIGADFNENSISASGGLDSSFSVFRRGFFPEKSDEVDHFPLDVWGFKSPDNAWMRETNRLSQQRAQMQLPPTPIWMQGSIEALQPSFLTSTTNEPISRSLEINIRSHSSLSDPIALLTHEITSRIKEVVVLKSRNSIIALTWSSLLEEICFRFFSPQSLLKYISLYWACWHPNWPVIHKPTFSIVSAHPVLVAAMALIGACVSPDGCDKDNAKTWLDSVEEMAFNDEDICDNSRADSATPASFDPSKSRRKVQALQAAYAVCLYQNWEGSDRNKSRIRRFRFSTVVAAARDLGLEGAKHDASCFQHEFSFEWQRFATREEYIRTLNYIFLLDTAFVIFNNLPPRMVVKEMGMDLVCPEPCFQASSADECFERITSWRSSKSQRMKISLSSAVETLLQASMRNDTCESFAELGVLNLFTIASAFHSLIFQSQASFSSEPQLAPLRHALSNWKDIWLLHCSTEFSHSKRAATQEHVRDSLDPSTMWTRIGFMRYAPEYWMLAKILLERLTIQRQANSAMDSFVDRTAMCPNSLPLGAPALEKYDETSMGQVNKIITSFQRLNV